MKALELTYAILESGLAGEPVRMADILESAVTDYQQEINEAAGI